MSSRDLLGALHSWIGGQGFPPRHPGLPGLETTLDLKGY